MRLEELRVIHLPKSRVTETPSLLGAVHLRDAFVLDSCQRKLWVTSQEALALEPFQSVDGIEVHAGTAAYVLLLRVACGLESQIAGETDIFGQLKEAWRECGSLSDELRADLSPWIQRLFEDTKEIRSRYLQNLGSATYGSLVRRILQDLPAGPVLLLGAGKIAKTVAPFVMDREIWLWNRSAANLAALHAELAARPEARVRMIETPEDEARALREAAHLVICIPVDDAQDRRRIAHWKQGQGAGRTVIHLGGLRGQCGQWESVGNFHSLNDLFELQKSQGEIRSSLIARAATACVERAKLRGLGTSVSIPHGWEDLAVFA